MSVHAVPQTLGSTDDDVAAPGHSRVWRALRRDPSFWIGMTAAVLIIAAAVLAPVLAPHDPNLQFRPEGRTPKGDPVGPSTSASTTNSWSPATRPSCTAPSAPSGRAVRGLDVGLTTPWSPP